MSATVLSASIPEGHAPLIAVGVAIASIVAVATATTSASAIFRAVVVLVARAIQARFRRATMGSNAVRLIRVCMAGLVSARRLVLAS